MNSSNHDECSFFETFDFANKEITAESFASVKANIEKHGIVRVQNALLSCSDYVELTERLGSIIILPSFLAPSKCSEYPAIARIANFTEYSEALNLNYNFGSYWHHDGDFWPAEENHIINLLYSRTVPESGGRTGFIDMQRAYLALSDDIKQILHDLLITVDPKNIEDFRGVADEVCVDSVEHRIVQHDEINDIRSLYIPYFEGTIGTTMKFTYDSLMKYVNQPEFTYFHPWKENEIIIWDNTKYMHRAMGEIEGKRLLWRTQARV
eukprot:gene7769-10554_t